MQCPKCHSDAPDFNTAEGVLLNFCNGCSGLWFDAGELALYCETEHDVPNLETLLSQAKATSFSCPRCQDKILVELPYFAGEDVLIDWCPACHGAWLDQQELGKIESLATRYENHTERFRRGMAQLDQAGFKIIGARRVAH